MKEKITVEQMKDETKENPISDDIAVQVIVPWLTKLKLTKSMAKLDYKQ